VSGSEGRLADAERAADLGGGDALLGLPERVSDQLLRVPGLLHRRSSRRSEDRR
jgi:hypothetical protein